MSDLDIQTLATSLLSEVKVRLGEPETNDNELKGYIVDTINELLNIGVTGDIVQSSASLGAITKGVKDQWNYEDGHFTQDFYDRADRLRRKVITNG